MPNTTLLFSGQNGETAVIVARAGKRVWFNSTSVDGTQTTLSMRAETARKIAKALIEGADLAEPILREAVLWCCETQHEYVTLVQGTEIQDNESVGHYNAFVSAHREGRTWVDEHGVTRLKNRHDGQ